MKQWEKVIDHRWQAKANHFFLLYLNVADYVFDEKSKKLKSIIEYLMGNSVVKKAPIVAIFNRELGIHFPKREMGERFQEFASRLGIDPRQQLGESKLECALRVFGRLLRISWEDKDGQVQSALKQCFPDRYEKKNGDPIIALIIEHMETKVPPEATSSSSGEDRNALEAMLNWAQSKAIADSRNVIIGLAESLTSIASQFRAETNGLALIKLTLPDSEKEREGVIEASLKELPKHEEAVDAKKVAIWTAGLSRKAISNLIKDCTTRKKPISEDVVFELKKKFIEEQSGGLAEIEKTLWDETTIGGMKCYLDYCEEITAALKAGNYLAVPQGVLAIGAPGLGKTKLFKVFARKAGIPFLTMKGVREMWVGQSERNLDFFIELAIVLAPVVIKIDDIDLELQSRDVMADNTGVNERMQKRLYDVMSNTELRGLLLWIGISNRPDKLDDAMLREGRFDDKLAFFPPDAKERALILPAILRAMEIQERVRGREFRWQVSQDFCEEFGWFAHRHIRPGLGMVKCDPKFHEKGVEEEDELPLNGGQIEKICNDAYRIACKTNEVLSEKHISQAHEEFFPSHSAIRQSEFTDLSLLYCNTERFLPDKWKKRLAYLRGQYQKSGGQTTLLK